MAGTIAEQYQGRWRGILIRLGIDETFLTNKHGPCPICQGKDRFRFDDKDGRGTYYCNGCGAGDAVQLLQRVFGWNIRETIDEIKAVAGEIDAQPFKLPIDNEARRAALNLVWAEAKSQATLIKYVTGRGIPDDTLMGLTTVRGTDRLFNSTTKLYSSGVVSLIQAPDRIPVSIHRIYGPVDADPPGGSKREKKIMPPLGTITGGAIRLGEPTDHLCVAEGLESGLAVRAIMNNTPTWCGISANGMKAMVLPKDLRQLDIFLDRDASFTGQLAGYTLAHDYLRLNCKCKVRVFVPGRLGEDPLDCYDIMVDAYQDRTPMWAVIDGGGSEEDS